MKKASGRIDKEGKDNGVGDWISVASPDDLFKHELMILTLVN